MRSPVPFSGQAHNTTALKPTIVCLLGAPRATCLNCVMAHEDPVSVLERWREHGAGYRVLRLSDEAAIVELYSCLGDPVERLESSDPGLLAYLRHMDQNDG